MFHEDWIELDKTEEDSIEAVMRLSSGGQHGLRELLAALLRRNPSVMNCVRAICRGCIVLRASRAREVIAQDTSP